MYNPGMAGCAPGGMQLKRWRHRTISSMSRMRSMSVIASVRRIVRTTLSIRGSAKVLQSQLRRCGFVAARARSCGQQRSEPGAGSIVALLQQECAHVVSTGVTPAQGRHLCCQGTRIGPLCGRTPSTCPRQGKHL